MIRTVAFACLLVVAVSPTWTIAADSAVLLEDGFETGEQAPSGWKQGANVAGVRYRYEKRVARTGSRSLCLEKTANRYFPIAEWSRIAKHTGSANQLKVSVQVRAKDVTKAIVDVAFLDQRNQRISHEWASYIGQQEPTDRPANHDWKEYAANVSVPPEQRGSRWGCRSMAPGECGSTT